MYTYSHSEIWLKTFGLCLSTPPFKGFFVLSDAHVPTKSMMSIPLVCVDNFHSKATFLLEKVWIISRFKVNGQPLSNVIFLLDWHFWVHSLYYKEEWRQRLFIGVVQVTSKLPFTDHLGSLTRFASGYLKTPDSKSGSTWADPIIGHDKGGGSMIKAVLHSLLHWL